MFNLSVDLVGTTASQGAMWPYIAVSTKDVGQAYLSCPAIAVGTKVHLLILDWRHSVSIKMLS